MSPSGDSLTSFMDYNERFQFWNRIASATPLPGKLTPKPQLKDIVKVYVENLRPKISARVKVAISTTTTVDEAEEIAELYVMKFRASLVLPMKRLNQRRTPQIPKTPRTPNILVIANKVVYWSLFSGDSRILLYKALGHNASANIHP
jgi:hypothetical protein